MLPRKTEIAFQSYLTSALPSGAEFTILRARDGRTGIEGPLLILTASNQTPHPDIPPESAAPAYLIDLELSLLSPRGVTTAEPLTLTLYGHIQNALLNLDLAQEKLNNGPRDWSPFTLHDIHVLDATTRIIDDRHAHLITARLTVTPLDS